MGTDRLYDQRSLRVAFPSHLPAHNAALSPPAGTLYLVSHPGVRLALAYCGTHIEGAAALAPHNDRRICHPTTRIVSSMLVNLSRTRLAHLAC